MIKITPDDKLISTMFADTITARMLRTLCRRSEMPQAEFMTLYHARCHRTNPSKSSFDNNFGRFLVGRPRFLPIIDQVGLRPSRNLLHWAGPGTNTPTHQPHRKWARAIDKDSIVALVEHMTIEDRYRAFTAIEKLTVEPRAHVDDDPEDLMFWFHTLRAPGFITDAQIAA